MQGLRGRVHSAIAWPARGRASVPVDAAMGGTTASLQDHPLISGTGLRVAAATKAMGQWSLSGDALVSSELFALFLVEVARPPSFLVGSGDVAETEAQVAKGGGTFCTFQNTRVHGHGHGHVKAHVHLFSSLI